MSVRRRVAIVLAGVSALGMTSVGAASAGASANGASRLCITNNTADISVCQGVPIPNPLPVPRPPSL